MRHKVIIDDNAEGSSITRRVHRIYNRDYKEKTQGEKSLILVVRSSWVLGARKETF